jgi:transcriptional regulator with XRE-family HTH domain
MNASDAGRGSVGDVGRRLRERRLELGLSVPEVAERAGVDSGYLEYAEENVASLSSSALQRLAAALETTSAALAGAGFERPPGRGRSVGSPVLERLDDEACMRLLEGGGIGRIVFAGEAGLTALPVNFALLDGDVVLRTGADGAIAEAIGPNGASVGFEVDHLDDALAEGWSVLIRGHAQPVGDDHLERVQKLQIESWAGGKRDLYVRVVPSELTGRAIRIRH